MQVKVLAAVTFSTLLALVSWQDQIRAADRDRDDPVEETPVSKDLESGREAVDKKNFDLALKHLTKAASETPQSADVHNLLGYSYRKLGKVDKAFAHYRLALKIDPEHRGANEYIGELYLETGEPAKAQKHLDILSSACFWGCEEYDDLKKAIDIYKEKQAKSQ